MFIEDIVILLVQTIKMNAWDSKLMNSFHEQIIDGNALTEKQAKIIGTILKRQATKLNIATGKDFSNYINNPKYKIPLRISPVSRKISIASDPTFGKLFKVEFPYNEEILVKIRNNRSELTHAAWNKDSKSWLFSINETSISFLSSLMDSYGFEASEEFLKYSNQLSEIVKNAEKYAPMLVKNDKTFQFVNTTEHVPILNTENLVEALFSARKAGISIWDSKIEEEISQSSLNDTTVKFLKSVSDETFSINLEDHTLYALEDIIKYMSPVLFVIPGGTELEKVSTTLDFLNSIGITNKEVSVLFRVLTEKDSKFNEFVKNKQLNSPISKDTKAVFISNKIRKSVLESKIYFNCIINFNFYNIHYQLRDYIKWHHDVIHVLTKKSQKETDFAFL
jgi:hypothetical protein